MPINILCKAFVDLQYEKCSDIIYVVFCFQITGAGCKYL